ncbi:unnamed protein product [Mucor circinelloides]
MKEIVVHCVQKDMDFYNEPTRNAFDIPQYESAIKDEGKKHLYSTCNRDVGANYLIQEKGQSSHINNVEQTLTYAMQLRYGTSSQSLV